ncbi:MAG: hypothetical protein ACRDKJ_12965 [Actinomycetota bacterium]
MPPEVPDHLVDRELELDLLGVAFLASFRLTGTDNASARWALHLVASLDEALFGCRDCRLVLRAVQTVIRAHGVAAPALVRNELRKMRAFDEMRYVLPSVQGGAAGVISAIDGYRDRLFELAKRRAAYLRATTEAAQLLESP